MSVRVVDIIQRPAWETVHKLRALEIGGRCLVRDFLADLNAKDKVDYRKVMKVLRMLGANTRVVDEKHVKRGGYQKEIYEVRAHRGHARVFFFYTPDDEEVVVCTSGYWKAKPSVREQNEAFETAARLRERYLESLGGRKGKTP